MHRPDAKQDMGHMIFADIVICRDCHHGRNPTEIISLLCPWISMCALIAVCDCQHEWSIIRNIVVYDYALWFDSLCTVIPESSLCV